MSGYDTITKIRIIFNPTFQRTNLIYAKSKSPTVKIANSNNPAAIDPKVSDLILVFMMFGFKYNAKL